MRDVPEDFMFACKKSVARQLAVSSHVASASSKGRVLSSDAGWTHRPQGRSVHGNSIAQTLFRFRISTSRTRLLLLR